jgi:serine protease Do
MHTRRFIMSNKFQFISLILIVAVSVIFGMVVNTTMSDMLKASADSPLYSTLPEASYGGAPNFADIAENAQPAVVTVIKSVKGRNYHGDQFDIPLEDFFWRYFGIPERRDRQDDRFQRRREERKPEEFEYQSGGGSGVILSADGYILTNNHVTDKASKIEVILENGEDYTAKLIGSDPEIDVSLLKIEPKSSLPVLPLGDSDRLRVGEWVMAIGNPYNFRQTVTVGVVSAKERKDLALTSDMPLASFIQTDAAINFGNSGGPLLNVRGEVVGINTAIYRQNLAEGIGFAIPINMVKSVLDQLKTTGKVSRGYLGVVISSISEEKKDYYKLKSMKGAFVERVEPGLPGDKAGIKPKDIIIRVDGAEVKDSTDLVSIIANKPAGEKVSVDVIRDGKEKTLEVVLGERDTMMGRSAEESEPKGEQEDIDTYAQFGFTVENLTRETRNYFKLDDTLRGVVIVDMKMFSDAWRKGIQEGHVISEVKDAQVNNLSDFYREIKKIKEGDLVEFKLVQRSGESRYVILRAEK